MKDNRIKECCCVGKPDKEHISGQVAVVYAVKNDNVSESVNIIADDLLKRCSDELSEKYVPKKIILISKLPLTSNGKVDFRALEKMSEEEN